MSNTSIDIGTLLDILGDHVDMEKKAQILRDINAALKEEDKEKEAEAAEKPPKIEKKMVVIITAMPAGFEEKDLENFAGFVTEVAEEMPLRDIKGAIREVKETFNGTKRGKKNPAETAGELFEFAGAKLFKENGLYKKPKGPLEFMYFGNR